MDPADPRTPAEAARAQADADRDINFDRVLSGGSSEKRTALIVFPIVLVVAAIVGLAFIAISRMSGLSTEVQIAQKQVADANKVVEERDAQLRDAHAETAVLGSAGQGAAVLAATSPESGASGIALDHPEQHALAVYAFNLNPAPEGQEYRLIVTDGSGQEQLAGVVAPSERGAAFLLARNLPEGLDRIEVALVPKSASGEGGKDANKGAPAASGQSKDGNEDATAASHEGGGGKPGDAKAGGAPPATRQPVLAGRLPRPGEAGVVAAAAPKEKAKPARAARRGR